MTLPKEVKQAVLAYAHACRFKTTALREWEALESAILSALAAAREGALREAVRVAETEEEFDGEIPEAVRWAAYRDPAGTLRGAVRATKRGIANRILALASRPEPEPCPKCGKTGAACWCPDAAWVKSPAIHNDLSLALGDPSPGDDHE